MLAEFTIIWPYVARHWQGSARQLPEFAKQVQSNVRHRQYCARPRPDIARTLLGLDRLGKTRCNNLPDICKHRPGLCMDLPEIGNTWPDVGNALPYFARVCKTCAMRCQSPAISCQTSARNRPYFVGNIQYL